MSDFSYYLLAVVVIGIPLWVGMLLALANIIPIWGMYVSVFVVLPWNFVVRRWAIKEKKKEKQS
jgi:hypothetical protein